MRLPFDRLGPALFAEALRGCRSLVGLAVLLFGPFFAAVMRRVQLALFTVTAGVLGLSLLGYAARDRVSAIAALSYLPLLPVALGAIGVALLPGAARRARVGLGWVGLCAALWALPTMVGWRTHEVQAPGEAGAIRLLQWNVLGGGSIRRWRWPMTTETIVREAPDIVVLSEAPPDLELDELQAQLGSDWSRVQVEAWPNPRYWYKLVLASRWPLQQIATPSIRRGGAVLVQVDAPQRPLRVLVVDGESAPTRDRSVTLDDIAQIMRTEAAAGTPVDVVAGDFNAPGRSQSFERIWEQGYRSAAGASGGWRGTFPAFLPLLDIDHVLVRAQLPLESKFFSSLSSDHRGQLVRLRADDSLAALE